MTESSDPTQDLIDRSFLIDWLDDHGIAPGESLNLRRITSGHSNEVFELTRGSLHLALRRPPRVHNTASAHDMSREFRVLKALWDHSEAIPVPRPIAFCDDLKILGVPFFLMDFVDGAVMRKHAVPSGLADNPEAPRHMSELVVDTLVNIHSFDWREAGLTDFGKPKGFLERQATRWRSQLEHYRTRSLPELEEVGVWLAKSVPPASDATLIHWDYRLDNIVFASDLPVRVTAVLDWEVATIGDPLIDLGWLLASWRNPGEDWYIHEAVMGQFPKNTSHLTRGEITTRYTERSGRDLSNIEFFTVLALYKLACLLEGFYTRYLRGQSDDKTFGALMEAFVPDLSRRALQFIP